MVTIDTKEIRVVQLTSVYNVSNFDCEDDDLNEFIIKDALITQKIHLARIYLLLYKEEQVLGFFSLSNDSIKLKPDEKYGTPKLENKKRLREVPSVKIGRLAVDKKFKGNGLGEKLLKIAIAFARKGHKLFGCRFITMDSYHSAVGFYEKYGFVKNEHKTYTKKDDYVSMRFDLLNESLSEEELKNLGPLFV